MEFHVQIESDVPDSRAIRDTILEAVRVTIEEVDPSAVLDIDPSGCVLRIAAAIDLAQLRVLLDQSGYPVPLAQVRQLPSICCGGCSG